MAATDDAEDEPKTLFGMLMDFMYVTTPQVAALYMPSLRSLIPLFSDLETDFSSSQRLLGMVWR